MYVVGPALRFALGSWSIWCVHQWLNCNQLKLIVLSLGSKQHCTFESFGFEWRLKGVRIARSTY